MRWAARATLRPRRQRRHRCPRRRRVLRTPGAHRAALLLRRALLTPLRSPMPKITITMWKGMTFTVDDGTEVPKLRRLDDPAEAEFLQVPPSLLPPPPRRELRGRAVSESGDCAARAGAQVPVRDCG